MKYVIYHNPRCSKSRQALEILRNHKIEPTVIEYLNSPPDAAELRRIVALLGLRPRDIVRTKEEEFAGANIDLENDDKVIKYLVDNPRMMERPIVLAGNKAVIGRPPENIMAVIKTA